MSGWDQRGDVDDLNERMANDDNIAYIKALAAADSHIDRGEEMLRRLGRVNNPDNVALVSIAHSLLACAEMLRHAFVTDYRDDDA